MASFKQLNMLISKGHHWLIDPLAKELSKIDKEKFKQSLAFAYGVMDENGDNGQEVVNVLSYYL